MNRLSASHQSLEVIIDATDTPQLTPRTHSPAASIDGDEVDLRTLRQTSDESPALQNIDELLRKETLFKWISSGSYIDTGEEEKARLYLEAKFEKIGMQLTVEAERACQLVRVHNILNDQQHLLKGCEACSGNLFLQRGLFADSLPFNIAVLYNKTGMVKLLLEVCPFYRYLSYQEDVYKGEHSIHIAVVNAIGTSQVPDLLRTLVEGVPKASQSPGQRSRKDFLNSLKAVGDFFHPKHDDHQVYWGETPVSFAVCLGLPHILRYLMENGGDIFCTDSQGNNVLHLLACQPATSETEQQMLVEMCEVVIHLSSQLCQFENNESGYPWLEVGKNHAQMTPLQLAAHTGNNAVFLHLMHRAPRKLTHWTYGTVTSNVYDLTDVDTFQYEYQGSKDKNLVRKEKSVLELLVHSGSKDAMKLLEVTPIRELLQVKWMSFAYSGFTFWMLIHIFYAVIFSLVVYYRPLKLTSCPENSTSCHHTMVGRTVYDDAYSDRSDFLRLIGELFIIFMTSIQIAIEVADIRHGVKAYFHFDGVGGVFNIIRWTCFVLIATAVVARLAEYKHEDVILSLSILFVWIYMLFFARGFQWLGPYIIMIQKMLFGDVFKFLVIYSIMLIAFALAFFALFQEAEQAVPEKFDSFWNSLITLFRATLGLTDIEISEAKKTGLTFWVVTYTIAFLIISYILLVNLVITMMQHTQGRLSEEQDLIWKKQFATVILFIELRMYHIGLKKLIKPVGVSGASLNLNEKRRYLRLEERTNRLKPFTYSSKDLELSEELLKPTISHLVLCQNGSQIEEMHV